MKHTDTSLIHTLQEAKQSIECINSDSNIFFDQMSQVWDTIKGVDDASIVENFKNDPRYADMKPFWSEKWNLYIKKLEWDVYNKALDQKTVRSLSSLSFEDYDPRPLEFMLCPKKAQSFIMLGCGPYPETILRAATYFNNCKRVVGVDKDNQALSAAAKITQMADLKKIEYINQSAETLDYSNYDVILLANGLMRKRQILNQIQKTATSGTYVLLRLPLYLGDLFYEDVHRNDIPNFKYLETFKPSAMSKTDLYYFEPKEC